MNGAGSALEKKTKKSKYAADGGQHKQLALQPNMARNKNLDADHDADQHLSVDDWTSDWTLDEPDDPSLFLTADASANAHHGDRETMLHCRAQLAKAGIHVDGTDHGRGGGPLDSHLAHSHSATSRHPSRADSSPLTVSADEYVSARLVPALRENQTLTPQLSRQLQLLTFVIIVLQSANAALVAYGFPLYVPLVLAVTSMMEFLVSYKTLETRIPNVNASTATLVKLLLWWDGLSVIQQRMPRSKEFLVESAEAAVLMQHEAYTQSALAALSDTIGERERDDREGKEGGA